VKIKKLGIMERLIYSKHSQRCRIKGQEVTDFNSIETVMATIEELIEKRPAILKK
jgi:hypothetical protein